MVVGDGLMVEVSGNRRHWIAFGGTLTGPIAGVESRARSSICSTRGDAFRTSAGLGFAIAEHGVSLMLSTDDDCEDGEYLLPPFASPSR